MEDSFVNFYDNDSLEDYINKIRTEIINGFEKKIVIFLDY